MDMDSLTKISQKNDNVLLFIFISSSFFSLWIMYLCAIFKKWNEKSNFNKKDLLKLIMKIESLSKECVTWTCLKFCPMKTTFQKLQTFEFGMACLQNYLRVNVVCSFLPSSYEPKSGTLLSLTFEISQICDWGFKFAECQKWNLAIIP